MTSPDPHQTLNLERGASRAEIRRAYRRLAFRWHPDRHPGDPEAAENRFLEIARAYSLLMETTPERRRSRTERRATRPEGSFHHPPPEPPPPPPSSRSAEPRPVPWRAVRILARELAGGERWAVRAERVLRGTGLGVFGIGPLLLVVEAPLSPVACWALALLAMLIGLTIMGWAFVLRERRVDRYCEVAARVLSRGLAV